ncbi:unnamed protein product [Rotaria socialis]|uniref:Uncharacterized protein n=1 Tax=Rotaria socialis TaxID=392032 RepID=A0A818ZWB1_9BILA|nr:unnamed protein product [Rotaria socialis]CAF3769563.1 unnamed protein product [Rotaria socialis]CAF4119748.1 unnamed protein product [Rotaria socialis]CAF4266875.1 unnamed protein product [Rotaria socialis]
MLNSISTTTVILTGALIIFILIYYQPFKNSKNLSNSNNSKELSDCSNELNKLRHERNGVKKNLHNIEQRFSLLHLISLSTRAIVSPLKLLSPSFILYTFILYIFHTCVSNRLASQTIKLLYITMSLPMFMYGLAAGSVVPLSIIYVMRPDSLKNLFDLVSSSLLIAFNWSEGVAQRFNLSNDLVLNGNLNPILPIKIYSCYTIEYWYNIFSWIIYISFILSLVLFILNQRFKNTPEESFHDQYHTREQENIVLDFVFYYFCIFILAMISISIRILMEYYFLRHLKPFTIKNINISMNETNLISIIFGVIVGFYTTIFLLYLSDIVYLSQEVIKIKDELHDIRNINQSLFSQISFLNSFNSKISLINSKQELSGQLCLSFNEQRQILDSINSMSNMAILLFTGYSLYIYGFGTHHGLAYRLFFFILKILTVILTIWLNLHFKQGLPNDILLYIWIDVNCIVLIYRSLCQLI